MSLVLDRSRCNIGLFWAAWEALAAGITNEACVASVGSPSLVSAFLDGFDDVFQEGTDQQTATRLLVRDIMQSSLTQCEDVLNKESADDSALKEGVVPLANNFRTFQKRLFADSEFTEVRFHHVAMISLMSSTVY